MYDGLVSTTSSPVLSPPVVSSPEPGLSVLSGITIVPATVLSASTNENVKIAGSLDSFMP